MAVINVWSKVAVAVQSALAAPRTITAITRANPAVVTSTAHGLIAGDIVLLEINGMRQLDYRVVRVLAAPTADTFTLEGVDSTTYDTFTSGTAKLVTLGANASTFQDVSASGGEAASISVSTIHDDQDFDIPGNRSPIVFSFGSLWDPTDPALVALKGFDDVKTPAVVQLTFATGSRVLMAAYVSAGLAPTGTSGQPVTTPVSLRLRGRLTTYAN
jgi:hypothetical protein